MNNDQDQTNRQNWAIFAMILFTIVKTTAIICATIIILSKDVWIGSALFLAALIFRITWTYMPKSINASTKEKNNKEEQP